MSNLVFASPLSHSLSSSITDGTRRFDLPSPINSYPPHDIIDATKYGFGCIAQDSEKIKSPQIAKVLNYIQGLAYPPEDEQCEQTQGIAHRTTALDVDLLGVFSGLSINIVRPANYDYENGEPLPVLVVCLRPAARFVIED